MNLKTVLYSYHAFSPSFLSITTILITYFPRHEGPAFLPIFKLGESTMLLLFPLCATDHGSHT